MIINSVRVQNFRSIRDETLECDALTAMVGRNGTGKSTFLRALERFYSTAPRFDIDDFFNRDPSSTIVTSVTFELCSDGAKTLFASYAEGTKLTVDQVVQWNGGKGTTTLHGSRLQRRDFVPIRSAVGAPARKEQYDLVRAQSTYADLPAWKSQVQGLAALSGWEAAHPADLERLRDDGQFFGFLPVAAGYLGRYTRLLSVPAVRDASTDAEERRGAVLTELMDLVVRSVLAEKADVLRLRADSQKEYERIFSKENLPELIALQGALTTTLRTFVPDAEVTLAWQGLEGVSIPLPKAEVRLVEDGFEASVDRTGHGLQRAFLMTLLEHLAMAQVPADDRSGPGAQVASAAPGTRGPNLVLAIEEPELFQHPSRQRHLASILLRLSSGAVAGVAKQTQVLYATHSPFFVGIDRIDQVRLLRKVATGKGTPKATHIVSTTLQRVADKLWEATGATGPKFAAETLRARLQTIMTPWMSEGFFSETVVLVEGEDDRAALMGVAKRQASDFDASGICVIPCFGKNNIDRPALIFSSLGIGVYLTWDNDRGANEASAEDNRRLLRIAGAPPEDWPSGVKATCSCFERDLETTLKKELGEAEYDAWFGQARVELGIPKHRDAVKNPSVYARVLELAEGAGKTSQTLVGTLARIIEVHARA